MSREARNSVFCDMFSRREYLIDLYRDLHPEDAATGQDDLEIVTIERVVSSGEYNDVGFVAAGRLLVLVEAQTEWDPNIATRMLLYLAETYRRIVFARGERLHGRSLVELPVPELYVIYSGAGDAPDRLSFSRDVLGGADSSIEVRVRVLRGGEGIVGEYVEFSRLVAEVGADESLAPHEKAAELVRLCLERGILSGYMEERQREVRGIMFTLFDQERETKLYHEELKREALESGRAEGLAEGLAEGRAEGLADGRAAGIERMVELLRAQGVDEDTIAAAAAGARA